MLPHRFNRPRGVTLPLAIVLVLGGLLSLIGGGAAFAAAPAPDFTATTLDGSGEVAVADLRGDVVLLNTWATWCTPCREEMPLLQSLADEFGGEGLQVVGVSIDRAGSEQRIREFADETGVTFQIWRDPENRFARTFRTSGVPETLLIGRDGSVLYTWKGPLTEGGADREIVADAVAGRLTADADPVSAVVTLTYPIAFGAGVLSFLSPCFLPLVPTYAAVFTGMGLKDLTASSGADRRRTRRKVFITGVAFIAGFSLVFILLGASATFVGALLFDYREWVMRIGGVLLVILGLHLLGVFRFAFAQRDIRFNYTPRQVGPAGSFLVGLAFGAGWTPCIGPVLGSILVLAAATASVTQGMLLLAVYAAGLAIPFLLATLLLDRFLATSRARGTWLPWLERASGVLVLIVAVLLMTGTLDRLAAMLA
jgi:cytochrome c-type biogenesis protein